MATVWCTPQQIDNKYNLGVAPSVGSLDGMTLTLTIDTVSKTLTLSCATNALDQTALISACNAYFTPVSFDVNYDNALVMSAGDADVIIGSGTANSIFGLLPGTNLVGTNALASTMFGIQAASSYYTQGAIDQAISSAGAMIESYLRRRYEIPETIEVVPFDLVLLATMIAGYYLQVFRGYSPKSANDIDNLYYKDYLWALQELDAYGSNRIHPNLTLTERSIPVFVGDTTRTMLGIAGSSSYVSSRGRGY
jgi:phage gp36-like protein